jgi:hypothetical protein
MYMDAPGTPTRVTVVVTAALDAASAVYATVEHAETTLAVALHEQVAAGNGGAGLLLVQTLPYVDPVSAGVVEAANAAVAATATTVGAAVVPVHRVADLDVLTAGEDFLAVACALETLGRRDRIGYLWNRLVDLAWTRWQALAPASPPRPRCS